MTLKLFGTRISLIIIGVLVLPYVFLEALVKETGNVFWYAWQKVRNNVASVKDKWDGIEENSGDPEDGL